MDVRRNDNAQADRRSVDRLNHIDTTQDAATLDAAIAQRRADPEFQARLARRKIEHADLLERLAQ